MPSIGASSKIKGVTTSRTHHFLSENETTFFYLVDFCDSISDIREQFPLLPLDLSLKIAKTLDYRHPKVPGTDTLNIFTTDFLLTVSDGSKTCFEAVSVKPHLNIGEQNVAKKLEIERLWWNIQNIEFHIFIPNHKNKIQSKNIQWFTMKLRDGIKIPEELISETLKLIIPGVHIIDDIVNKIARNQSLDKYYAMYVFKYMVAKKLMKVNMDLPIVEQGVVEIFH